MRLGTMLEEIRGKPGGHDSSVGSRAVSESGRSIIARVARPMSIFAPVCTPSRTNFDPSLFALM